VKSIKVKVKTKDRMMSFLRRAFILLTFPFLLSTNASTVFADESAGENRLMEFLNGLETFSAGFEQTLYNEFGQELESSSGNVYLAQPGKFHWAYQQPYIQYLISNGSSLWIYDEDLEQVTISTIGDSVEKSPASILTGDVDLDDNYDIIELGRAEETDWIELIAKDANSQYNSIRLGFNQQELSGMVIFDNLGQRTLIMFTDAIRNAELDPVLFEFEPPAGVDVIDSRE
jgi:outer membrane lipoprotein carrier protein